MSVGSRRGTARRAVACAAVALAALTAVAACAPASRPTPTAARASMAVPTASARPAIRTPSAGTPTQANPATNGAPAPTSHRIPQPNPPSPPADRVGRALAAMSEAQRVGQLFMVDASATGPSDATLSAITDYHVGSVILMNGKQASMTGTAAVTADLQRHAAGPAGLLVATDQEGGDVQALAGAGFADIPSALAQGELPPAQLRANARNWGEQLAAAGVNVDLAPVLDTVAGQANPIGADDRGYGFDIATVASHGTAFAAGLADAGILATAKHFPGLGRVSANTDNSAQVTDTVTTSQDPFLAPFAAAIRAGIPLVMVSTAYYSRIDPAHPAVFSPTVINTVLRGRLGFRGVVISDDVGAAAQVAGVPIGDRAVQVIAAGGDVVLTVDPSQIPEMTAAVLQRADRDAAFRAAVDSAARRVLAAKQTVGLLRES